MTRLRVLLLIMYVLLIFFVSSRPYLQSPGPDFHLKDKAAHLTEYLVLGLLLSTGIGYVVIRKKTLTFLFLFAVGASIAGMDEVFQSYIPGRRMDFYDWLADVAGVAFGVGVCVTTGFGIRNRVSAARGEAKTGAGGEAL